MLELPVRLCVLFVGVILSNGPALVVFIAYLSVLVPVLGNVSLSLFPAMALMSLKLGTGVAGAADAGVPWRRTSSSWRCTRSSSPPAYDGENYDAAVLAAFHCGFGLAQRRPPLLICRRLPTVLALSYGVPGGVDGRRVLYRYRQCVSDRRT